MMFLKYILIFNVIGNNTEAGMWYHRPYRGKDLVITHNLTEAEATCTVEPPFLNYNLQVSKPTNPIYRDVLRYLFVVICSCVRILESILKF